MTAIEELMYLIRTKESRVVVGLDPTESVMPEIYSKRFLTGSGNKGATLYQYCKEIIDAIYSEVPAVKPNIAFFERYGAYEAYFDVCAYAKQRDLVVIADAKRGDICSTSAAYADAFLSASSPIDFLTINAYFGTDSVKPFLDLCEKNGKGVFALVKTSNDSSSEIQDLVLEDGRKVYEKVADLVSGWGNCSGDLINYSNVGAVVGATHPKEAANLRKIMKNTFFLVPGYGAQGATADDIVVNFDSNGEGAIINSSRGILGAFKNECYSKFDFQRAACESVIQMNQDINSAIERSRHK